MKENPLLRKDLLEPRKQNYKYLTSVLIHYSTYVCFNEANNKEDSKFKVGDHVRISK